MLRYGMEHWKTRSAARSLVSNLRKVGQREEAEALADKHGLAAKHGFGSSSLLVLCGVLVVVACVCFVCVLGVCVCVVAGVLGRLVGW